jgi:prepilin-type N-terminal cleavage/methylation domain-containing protein
MNSKKGYGNQNGVLLTYMQGVTRQQKQQAGFTLLELVIVVVAIGILLTLILLYNHN